MMIGLVVELRTPSLNSELCRKALEKVGNPNVLVNIVSRRVRQLNSGGSTHRPLLAGVEGLGAAEIAMLEITEGKLSWDMLPETEAPEPTTHRRRRGG